MGAGERRGAGRGVHGPRDGIRGNRCTAARLQDAVCRGIEKTLGEGLEIARAHLVDILKSDDDKEGLTAFAERRQPVFD